jgi:TonB family protein
VFSVGRAGNLVGITIKQSSGTPLADQAAIQAIQVSAPFKPLPPNYRGNTIDVLFTFDYNVLSGSMR